MNIFSGLPISAAGVCETHANPLILRQRLNSVENGLPVGFPHGPAPADPAKYAAQPRLGIKARNWARRAKEGDDTYGISIAGQVQASQMKIQGPGSLRPGQAAKKTRGGDSSEFSKHLEEGEGAAPRAAAAGGVATVNPLMALQEVDDSLTGKRQAQQRAESILDRLEELRMGLLMGSFPREKLADLVRMVQSRRATVNDPRLAEILDDIDLRAQVEIAKLQQRD